MNAYPQIHGRKNLRRWQVEQAAQREISRTSYRSPNFVWRKDAPRNRAQVTVYLTLTDNRITTNNVVISRNFYRGGERRYSNVSLASLRRLSALAPLPLLTDAQFEAAGLVLVAQEMLAAGKAQQSKLADRIDAALAVGQAAELMGAH